MIKKITLFAESHLFLLILVISFLALKSLLVPGFYGASDDLHIAWLHQMDASLRAGQFPPRFVPDLSFGYGYPLFNFVFPLPFYLGEIFHLFGMSFVDSVKAVFLITIPLSGYFMYKFLREYSSFWVSLAGAAIYIYTPYRATDIYIRGAFGEALAFVFPPLIAYSIIKIAKNEEKIKWVALLALSTAGLILSHNIMAYMFFPFLVIFSFLPGFRIKTFAGFVWGLAISVYFWLPAIIESSLMKYDTVFNFYDHFPTLKQLFTPYFGYGASVPGPYDGMSFFVGAVNLVLIVLAVFFFRKNNKVLVWALSITAVSIFMMNYRSAFVWQNLPLLPYFQFPWRFLSLTVFATSVLVIVVERFKYRDWIAMLLIAGVIAVNFSFFRPHDFLGRRDDYYLNRYIPVPAASDEYLKTGEEYLRLPKATEKRPTKVSNDRGLSTSFEVDLKFSETFSYNKYYFPGWQVKIDGKNAGVGSGSPYGQIAYEVPAGKHKIEIDFKETPFRKILDIVSLAGLAAALIFFLKPVKK